MSGDGIPKLGVLRVELHLRYWDPKTWGALEGGIPET